MGRASPALLKERAASRYQELLSEVGPEVLDRVERQLTLFHIDRCWAEYLDHVGHIRDGIHLISGVGHSALDTYHRQVGKAFGDLIATIDNSIVETFLSATITAEGIDLEKEGLKGPSSTWTYLINDNPFDGWFGRVYKTVTHSSELLKSLRRAVTYKSS